MTARDLPPIPMADLRPMTTADLPAVLEAERRLFPADAWPESFFREELAASAANPALPERDITRRYWVAVETADVAGQPESIVGYAGLMCVLPLADVQTIAVAPQARRTGLGTRLLRCAIDAAVTWGAEQLLLEVRADNPGAQALYRREGFETIHVRPRYYPDGEDALVMRRTLRAPRPHTSASDLRS